MNLLEKIFHDKEEFYNLALEYFHNINSKEHENIDRDEIIPKSISILIDYDFISTP